MTRPRLKLSGLIVTARYLQKQSSGLFYFRRGIPQRYQSYFNGKTHFRKSLQTRSEPEALRALQRANKDFEAALRKIDSGDSVRTQALRLLDEFDINHSTRRSATQTPEAGSPEWALLEHLGDKYRTYSAGLDGYEVDYDRPLPHEEYALQIVRGKEPLTLDRAKTLALEGASKKRANEVNRAFECLIACLPSTNIIDITNADVRACIRSLTDRDQANKASDNTTRISSATAKKYLGIVRSSVEQLLIDSHSDFARNPFSNIKMAGLKGASQSRETCSPEQLAEIAALLQRTNLTDSARAVGLLVNTGCRLGEVGALALEDIDLESEVPHINLKDTTARSLKTRYSVRAVPLFGASLRIAKMLKQAASPSQVFCFPRWINSSGTYVNDRASAAVNKYLRANIGAKITSHSFRHTMNTRLVEAGCNQLEIENWMGWSSEGMLRHYGKPQTLAILAQVQRTLTDCEASKQSRYKTPT